MLNKLIEANSLNRYTVNITDNNCLNIKLFDLESSYVILSNSYLIYLLYLLSSQWLPFCRSFQCTGYIECVQYFTLSQFLICSAWGMKYHLALYTCSACSFV